MTRNEALEKINKCIALATNAGATEGEKQNAWAMAEKLASKYGFKIVKQEALKTTDINFYNRTMKEEPKSVQYVVYKVSRFDARIVSRILFKLGYRYAMTDNGFWMSDDQKFDFDAFKKLYKLIMKQYDEDLKSFKVYGWNRSWSIQFKRDWIFGMGYGLDGEEPQGWFSRFIMAGYNAGMKYRSYANMIRKEVA